jgi:hypothetical protein
MNTDLPELINDLDTVESHNDLRSNVPSAVDIRNDLRSNVPNAVDIHNDLQTDVPNAVEVSFCLFATIFR